MVTRSVRGKSRLSSRRHQRKSPACTISPPEAASGCEAYRDGARPAGHERAFGGCSPPEPSQPPRRPVREGQGAGPAQAATWEESRKGQNPARSRVTRRTKPAGTLTASAHALPSSPASGGPRVRAAASQAPSRRQLPAEGGSAWETGSPAFAEVSEGSGCLDPNGWRKYWRP
jgi:hypothetical protein